MNPQKFLAEFTPIANAPGGMDRLRRMILHMAMQGKLVRQVAAEGRAVDQLNASRLQMQKGMVEGVVKKEKPAQDVARHEMVFSIPENWVWCRVVDTGQFINGRGFKQSEWVSSGRPIIRIQNLSGASAEYNYTGIDVDESIVVRPGDLLVSWSATLNVFIWKGEEGVLNQHIFKVTPSPLLNKAFLFWLLKWVIERLAASDHAHGLVMNHINREPFLAHAVAIPPFSEQSRIVAKLDELMALSDELEEQQRARRQLQSALRQSTLQTVAAANSPHERRTTSDFLAKHFGRLFSEPLDVSDFVAALNSLAVRGHLVEASEVAPDLKAIKTECGRLQAQYMAAGLMRRQKPVGMAACETSYPEHWGTVALDEVAIVIGGVTKGRDLRGKRTIVCPYLAVANVQRGYFKLDKLKSIEIAADEFAKYRVLEGDLLITEGGDWDKVGRTAIWRGEIEDCLHQNHVFKARVPSTQLLKEWVELVFNSDVGRDYFAGASKQTTNLASINMTQLRSFPLPVPPLDEQKRILSGLAALMQQCTEWSLRLGKKQSIEAALANAAVASLTGITVVPDEESPVKVPQTELIAQLRLGQAPDAKAQAPLATILARHQGELSARDLWQRFGGEVDAFYAQLKAEVAHGWISEPERAEIREKPSTTVSA